MILSKSKVNSYMQCPRLFRFTYIDKLERPEPKEDSPLKIGTDVHTIFETLFKENDFEDLKDLTGQELEAIMLEYPNADKYTDHIHNFSKFIRRKIREGYKVKEVELYARNEVFGIHGYIDLILERDGKLTVIDYKTGKKAKPITDYELELCYYALLVQEHYNMDVEFVGIYFSKVNQTRFASFIDEPDNKGAWISQEDVEAAFKYLFTVHKKVEAGEFPFKKNFFCKTCDFKDECDREGFDSYGQW